MHAFVKRTDPPNNCNDGYCDDGPTKEGGYSWTLTLMTHEDNLTPTSPTGTKFGVEGTVAAMTATNQVRSGEEQSDELKRSLLPTPSPF